MVFSSYNIILHLCKVIMLIIISYIIMNININDIIAINVYIYKHIYKYNMQ